MRNINKKKKKSKREMREENKKERWRVRREGRFDEEKRVSRAC
jgi:hypothetical protein